MYKKIILYFASIEIFLHSLFKKIQYTHAIYYSNKLINIFYIILNLTVKLHSITLDKNKRLVPCQEFQKCSCLDIQKY